MPSGKALIRDEDKAWVTFKTSLNKNSLLRWCQDIERLLRINPYLVFEKWEKIGEQQFHYHVVNHSQSPAFKIETNVRVRTNSNSLEIHYAQGLKTSTSLTVESVAEGSKLTITERYKAIAEDELQSRLHEVDKSLVKWAEDIQSYLVHWQRWSWFMPWRFYMQRIWLPMKPTARRISFMLLWISAIELILIGLGTIIYFVEYK